MSDIKQYRENIDIHQSEVSKMSGPQSVRLPSKIDRTRMEGYGLIVRNRPHLSATQIYV